jgi:hypothetical protein
VDPLFEKTMTPYQYTYQNPINYTDPTGMKGEWTGVEANSDGTYRVVAGEADNDKNIYLMKNGERTGEVIGQSLTEYSFHGEDGKAILGSIINPNDTSGIEFLNNEIINNSDLNLISYMKNATGYGKYDFKTRGIDKNYDKEKQNQYKYRGVLFQGVDRFSQGADGGTTTFASARDIGNVAAGYVAGSNGLPWKAARLGFDGLQSVQGENWKTGRWHVEGKPTQRAERVGHNAGISDFRSRMQSTLKIHVPPRF